MKSAWIKTLHRKTFSDWIIIVIAQREKGLQWIVRHLCSQNAEIDSPQIEKMTSQQSLRKENVSKIHKKKDNVYCMNLISDSWLPFHTRIEQLNPSRSDERTQKAETKTGKVQSVAKLHKTGNFKTLIYKLLLPEFGNCTSPEISAHNRRIFTKLEAHTHRTGIYAHNTNPAAQRDSSRWNWFCVLNMWVSE